MMLMKHRAAPADPFAGAAVDPFHEATAALTLAGATFDAVPPSATSRGKRTAVRGFPERPALGRGLSGRTSSPDGTPRAFLPDGYPAAPASGGWPAAA